MSDLVFSMDYKVHVYETGFNGLLQPYALFNYLQDIAAVHAERSGFGRSDLMKMNRFWVLSGMEVIIRKWPSWEDLLTVSTWPRGTDRFFAVRDFRVKDPDGSEIAAASSSWLIIDSSTKKIRRPHEELTKYNNTLNEPAAIGKYAGKIEMPSMELSVSPVNTVKTGDIDVNMHTNNTSYIRWVFNTYNPDFLAAMVPQRIEVNFLSESRYGDNFIICSGVGENNIHYHTVKDETGNKEYCRLRIKWENRNH
ncbi:MAG: hypothetical protein GYA43_03930 [Bacteroidales bacterium]|nr:hypothetical protein [Bacteroidales bacterium]